MITGPEKEINKLDKAYKVLNESLTYEDNIVARKELNYIEHLLGGGEKFDQRSVRNMGDTTIFIDK